MLRVGEHMGLMAAHSRAGAWHVDLPKVQFRWKGCSSIPAALRVAAFPLTSSQVLVREPGALQGPGLGVILGWGWGVLDCPALSSPSPLPIDGTSALLWETFKLSAWTLLLALKNSLKSSPENSPVNRTTSLPHRGLCSDLWGWRGEAWECGSRTPVPVCPPGQLAAPPGDGACRARLGLPVARLGSSTPRSLRTGELLRTLLAWRRYTFNAYKFICQLYWN